MGEKVKVSREVANFIESCKSNGTMYWEDELLYGHGSFVKGGDVAVREDAKCLNKYSTFELAQILVLGYEIEETPEERLLKAYQRQIAWANTENTTDRLMHKAHANGIVFTLETLGVKIKGINK